MALLFGQAIIQALCLCPSVLTALVNLAAVYIAGRVAVRDEDNNPTAYGLLCMILAWLLRVNGFVHWFNSFRSFNSVMLIHDYNRSIHCHGISCQVF